MNEKRLPNWDSASSLHSGSHGPDPVVVQVAEQGANHGLAQ
jgi:hypothetical protein